MQYGFFDDKNKEYVIERPDTPRSWSNYLGSTEYGAIITNNAGGYSFYKSAAQGRFMRLRFNIIPMDQPGRYFYIHDKDNKDFWSTSWQPVGKSLKEYKSECRHGTAYTKISSKYSNIKTESLYFVPLGKTFECWFLKITNNDEVKRNLSVFTYVEYANNWNQNQDMNNLQYSQYILKMDVVDNIIDHGTNVYMPANPENFQDDGQSRHTFLAIQGAEVKGFDTDREIFLGPYRTYANPIAVEKGECSNSIAVGDNGCGTLHVDVELAPDETKEIIVLMGIGSAAVEGKIAIKELGDSKKVLLEFEKLKNYWHSKIDGMTVESPDRDFNSMFNTWNPYNNLMTFAWSRAASLVYSGERDGLGYRDTVQDMLGIIHAIPSEVKDRLELMITGQVSNGGAMPVVKPFAHKPGYEKTPDDKEFRSDDCMWLFNTIPAYVKETGDISFYEKILPYADKGEESVFAHLKRAIQFNLDYSGKHGFPCGLSADWNDCLVLGQDGETTFVAFQLRYALKTYIEIGELLKKDDEIKWASNHLKILDINLEKYAWDGEWYLRAYRADGLKFGSKENDEGSIFLEPQPWAVISGHTSKEQSEKLLNVVNKKLSTDFGVMICDPPIEKTDPHVIKARLFNKGMKENASIFQHTQSWVVIAETLIGRGNLAYDYFRKFMPSAYNSKAELRQTEPYVYAQFTCSKYNPHYGSSRLPWLSGTASWAYYTAAQFILGIQPEYNGLKIDPCIPSEWREIRISRKFREKNFDILISNETNSQKGVQKIILNDREIDGIIIPVEMMRNDNKVLVIL
ncbi:MAG: N,N'-diacetylchitobiose phosphorylase [Melioribacteraceae bacterium]|nr:N,N'-diacetylchitobiose phosphorylase [Melioribacteraceae bacterium]